MLIAGLWDLIMANAESVKVVQPLYEPETRAFKGLQETIEFIGICGDTDERVL